MPRPCPVSRFSMKNHSHTHASPPLAGRRALATRRPPVARRLRRLFAPAIFAALAPGLFADAPLSVSDELLVNPGAEAGPAAPGQEISGWARVAGTSFTTPSVDGGTYDPGLNPRTGAWQFVGDTYPVGGGAEGGLVQIVDVSAVAGFSTADIDAGRVAARVGFWERSLYQGGTPDSARIELGFRDGAAQSMEVAATPNLASDGGGGGAGGGGDWTYFEGDYVLPAGTRSIAYTMLFFRGANGGTYIDAFIDDNSLRLVPAAAIPEPAAAAWLAAALAFFAAAGGRRGRLEE